MALPISPTPTLTGREAATFLKQLREDARKPVGLVATPNLPTVNKIAKQYGRNRQKHVR